MESDGAEVISYDLDRTGDWDMVPFAKWTEREDIVNERKEIIGRLNNAYWFAHRRLNSNTKVVYGSVYAIPDEIGPVDCSVYGSILLHLRDPFLALQNGLKLTKKTVIISEICRGQETPTLDAYLGLLPDHHTMQPKDTWWDIRPEWVTRAIGVLGFEESEILHHKQKYEGREIEMYTVVGKRK